MSSWLSPFKIFSPGTKEPPTTVVPPSSTTSLLPPPPALSTPGIGNPRSTIRSALQKKPSRMEFLKESWAYIQSTTAYQWISPPFIWCWNWGCKFFWAVWEAAFPPTTPPQKADK